MFKRPGTYEKLFSMMPPYVQDFISLDNRLQPGTLFGYMTDYRIFFEWMIKYGYTNASHTHDISIEDLDRLEFNDIVRFLSYVAEGYESHRKTNRDTGIIVANAKKGGGQKRKLSALRALFFHLHEQQNLLTHNELTKFKSYFKSPQRQKTKIDSYLREDEIARLIDAVQDLSDIKEPYLTLAKRNLKRDIAINVTFLDTGIRVSTLCAMNIRDIDFENGEAVFNIKGGFKKRLPLKNEVLRVIKDYLNDPNRAKPVDQDAQLALFLSSKGRRIEVRTVQQMVKKYFTKAGITGDKSVHSLRHTFGTQVYKQTRDIKLTADLLVHSDPSITAKFYAASDEEAQREALKSLPPLLTDNKE